MERGQVQDMMYHYFLSMYDDPIKWKHCSHYWPFVRGIHRSPADTPHKGQRTLMFSLICAWTNSWANNREDASDLRRHRAHYDITAMTNFEWQNTAAYHKWTLVSRQSQWRHWKKKVVNLTTVTGGTVNCHSDTSDDKVVTSVEVQWRLIRTWQKLFSPQPLNHWHISVDITMTAFSLALISAIISWVPSMYNMWLPKFQTFYIALWLQK